MFFKVRRIARTNWILIFLFAGSVLLLGGGLGGLAWAKQQASRAARGPLALETLLSTLKDAETGQRGYLLTGDDRYLEPYRSALRRYAGQLAEAKATLGGSPDAMRLDEWVTEKLAELEQTITLRRAGAAEQALQMVKTDRGKLTMDEIRRLSARAAEITAAEAAGSERASQGGLAAALVGSVGLLALGVNGVVKLRRSGRSLAASEAQARLLVAGIDDHAIYMLDEEGRILTWNAGAERLMGLSPTDAVGQSYATLFSAEDQRNNLPERLLATARLEGAVESEGIRVRRDGSTFTAHLSLTAVFDEAGKVCGYCKVARNVTDQREVELMLERGREELEALVAERSRSWEETRTRQAHAHRMEALGQLAGGVAHDFNNVLQAVQGCASLIEMLSGDERVRGLAKTAADASERGSAITRRLLAFSRRVDLQTEAVDAAVLLGSMRELLLHTLGREIEVVVEAPPDLPAISVDKSQLETVLINLATNARDAMSGAGLLTLAAVADEVPEGVADGSYPEGLQPGRYVRLSVADSGVGMTPEVLARVTEPFFTTKPAGEGTGLGLAMAKAFSEQSGGGIRIESAWGRGTTVMLWLKLADVEPVRSEPVQTRDPAPSAAKGSRAKGSTAKRGVRILLADDDPIVRGVVTLQLEKAGYSVLPAQSGSEALAALDAGEAVDLIIADLSMPEMSGIACIHEAHERQRELPAILMTGFATNAVEIAVQGALASDFTLLRKPVSASYLTERIEILLAEAKRSAGSTKPG